jgi:PKD repeat protein
MRRWLLVLPIVLALSLMMVMSIAIQAIGDPQVRASPQSGELVVTSSSPTALGEITTFTATLTVSGDFTCTWDLDDGTLAEGLVVTHTYPTVGMYTAMVTATNGTLTYIQTTTVSVDIPIASPLLSEGFEGPWLPVGWSSSILAPSVYWQHASAHAYRGVYSAFHDDAFGMQDAWLVTRRVTPTAESQLVFWQFERYAPYYYRHSVWVSTGSPDPKDGDFVELAQVMTGAESTWGKVSVSLGAFAGRPCYLAFRYQGNNADEWYIDDVQVTTALVASHNGPKQPGEIVTFMAYAPTGSNVDYIWNLGDGVIRSGATVTYAYSTAGSYTAVVTASNSVNSVTKVLTVPIWVYSYLPLVIRH